MKIIKYVSAGLLLAALGIAAPTYSQQQDDKNKQQENKQQPPPKQQEQPRQQTPPKQEQRPAQQQPKQQPQRQPQSTVHQSTAKPQPTQQPKVQSKEQPKQQPAKTTTTQRPQQAYGGAYHGGVKATAPTNGGVHPSGVPQHSGQVRSGFAQSKAGNWSTDHKTWQQRGGYTGYRIPDARFNLYFGRDHSFRISGLPILFVGGFPRFQYDGYWITFVDPWPDNWPPNWYETDNIYLDYTDDGYYLYDANYPGIGIAVTVSM